MILLTRFHSGERFAINPDVIERVEETPDTVITLTNGTKHVVQESIDEIIENVQIVKAALLALARRMVENPDQPVPAHLHIVHNVSDANPEVGLTDPDVQG